LVVIVPVKVNTVSTLEQNVGVLTVVVAPVTLKTIGVAVGVGVALDPELLDPELCVGVGVGVEATE
jgi:hypothetical protein